MAASFEFPYRHGKLCIIQPDAQTLRQVAAFQASAGALTQDLLP